MTERDPDTEKETDGYQFRWSRCWRQWDPYGGLREYSTMHTMDGTERLAEARARHADDRRGGWVEHGMIDPHVTGLRVRESGRVLPEELADHEDLPEVAEQIRFV